MNGVQHRSVCDHGWWKVGGDNGANRFAPAKRLLPSNPSPKTVNIKKTDEEKTSSVFLAEGEGFEPPEALTSAVFKTVAIDHSANLPYYYMP